MVIHVRLCALALACALAACSQETTEVTAEPLPGEMLTGLGDCDLLIAQYAMCLALDPERHERDGVIFDAERVSLRAQAQDPSQVDSVGPRCRALLEPKLAAGCDGSVTAGEASFDR